MCVSAGDPLDKFTVPRGEWAHGIAGALSRFTSYKGGHSSRRNDASKLMEPRASSGVSCKEVVVPLSVSSDERSKSKYVDIIRYMSRAEMKRFLSAVRDRLCLRAFVWPDEAKESFRAETLYPIPGAPGRSNSRKSSLILMITICVEVDEVWRKAILAEIQERRGKVKQRKKPSETTGKSIGRHLQCFRQHLDNLRTQQGVSNSGVTTTSVQKRTKENATVYPAEMGFYERYGSCHQMASVLPILKRNGWISLNCLQRFSTRKEIVYDLSRRFLRMGTVYFHP